MGLLTPAGDAGPWRPEPARAGLVEREDELALLAGGFAGLERGRGGVITFEGAHGTGRSALLGRAVDLGGQAGFRVHVARCALRESALPWALARKLWVSPRHPGETALGRPHGASARAFAARLAGAPAVLVVDDVQWLDQRSAHWLATAIAGLRDEPVLVVLAAAEPVPDELLSIMDAAVRHQVRPLSGAGVRAMLASRYTGEVPARVVEILLAGTGGNPAVLAPLIHWLADREADLGRQDATPARARIEVIKRARTKSFVARLPAACAELLRAIAVAEGDLPLASLEQVARLTSEAALRCARLLSGCGLIDLSALPRLTGAVTAAQILEEVSLKDRQTLYRRAALVAAAAGRGEGLVGRLLLPSSPIGGEWAVGVLHRQALAKMDGGLPGRAVELLDRALKEPLSDVTRIRLMLDRGLAATRVRPEAGDRALYDVLLSPGTGEIGRYRLRAADFLLARGNSELLCRAIAIALSQPLLPDAERSALTAIYWLADDAPYEAPELGGSGVPRLPTETDDPDVASALAWELASRSESRARARELALYALDAARTLSARLQACRTLILTDDLDAAERGLGDIVAEGRRYRASAMVARALLIRANLGYHTRNLKPARQDLADARAQLPPGHWHRSMRAVFAASNMVLRFESGKAAEAMRELTVSTPDDELTGYSGALLTYAYGLGALGTGRPADAVEFFLESGRRLQARHWSNPGLLAWRALAALAMTEAGRKAEAVALLLDQLKLVRSWGSPTAIGWTCIAIGRAVGGAESAGFFAEAVRTLRNSTAEPRLAIALVELATAHAEAGRADLVPRLLREAGELAERYGMRSLVKRVRALGDPRGLTPTERRVAQQVADGLSNAEIAEGLAVTRRSVEHHLTSVYRKLGITRRGELAQALARLGLRS
jgi:DNA-binding CsgD family transcriptional regulator